MMSSLRSRLLIGTALATAAVFLLAGAALHAMMQAKLLAEFDSSLEKKARTLADLVEQEGGRIELEFEEANMPEFRRDERPEFFQVWLSDGRPLARSPSLKGRDLATPNVDSDRPTIHAAVLPNDRPGRIVTLRFSARADGGRTPGAPAAKLMLALGRDVLDVHSALAELRVALLIVGAAAMLLSLALLAWLVTIGLRPASRLAQSIASIDERRLQTRIDGSHAPNELRPIVTRLNEMLGRLDDAFAREKAMTASVAHELRTPLAGLRSTIEVALARERDSTAYRQAMSACLTICRQTQSLVENLLELARLDADGEAVRRRSTDLASLARETWAPFVENAMEKHLRVEWHVEPGLAVETDPDKLRLVLRNLFENAVHYANDDGDIRVEAGRDNGALRFQVSNTGSRISADDAPRVFDRFWRGDAARSVDGVHAGLGLPLCKTLVERLGGTITAQSVHSQRFSITLTL
jgi:heavy metal sensor kinase